MLIHRRLGSCLISLMLLHTLRGRTFPELLSTAPSPKLHLRARTHTISFCYYLTLSFFPHTIFLLLFHTGFFSPLKTWCFYLKSHPLQFVLSWQQDSLPCPKPIPRLIVLITTPGITLHTDEPLMWAALPAAGLIQLLLWGYGCTRRRERVSLSQIFSTQRNQLYSRHFFSMPVFLVLVKTKRPRFMTCLSSAIKNI